jgi:hypothetical protein
LKQAAKLRPVLKSGKKKVTQSSLFLHLTSNTLPFRIGFLLCWGNFSINSFPVGILVVYLRTVFLLQSIWDSVVVHNFIKSSLNFFTLYQKWFIYYLSDPHPILLNYIQLYMFGLFTFYSWMLFVTTATSQKVQIKETYFLSFHFNITNLLQVIIQRGNFAMSMLLD